MGRWKNVIIIIIITLTYLLSVRNLISPAVNDMFPQLISFYLLMKWQTTDY